MLFEDNVGLPEPDVDEDFDEEECCEEDDTVYREDHFECNSSGCGCYCGECNYEGDCMMCDNRGNDYYCDRCIYNEDR